MSEAAAERAGEPSRLPAAGRRTEVEPQWRLESLQMVNWGGFEGHHEIGYHPESTLVSGGSGTGKSTMLDAYTALIMPWKVPFNGASNDAGSGRARDEAGGQRTLLTYLRGKVGNTDEGGGNKSASVLRGKGRPTWGGVGGTFLNTDGTAFTAARVYYVPATAVDVSGIQTHMLTFEGRLDLAQFSEVMTRFVPSSQQLGRVLVAAVPGVRRHETYDRFSSTLFSKLAIGADADGEHALALLARIQASKAFPSVNDLYRRLVLDEPVTFADADRAIGHFDTLEDNYRKMETDAAKAQVLRDIPKIHQRLVDARRDTEQLDTFGLKRASAKTPVHLWTLQTENRLLDTAITMVVTEKKATNAKYVTAVDLAAKLKGELAAAQFEYNKHGGADLTSLDTQIQTAQEVLASKKSALSLLSLKTEPLGLDYSAQDGFDAAQAASIRFGVEYRDRQAVARKEQQEILSRQLKLSERRTVVRDELASLRNRKGRIPKRLDDLRRMVADTARIPVGELPFLAEVIDIAEGEGRWRLAAETVLGGDARRMLVPNARFQAFSESIDHLQLHGRITFAAAEADRPLKFPLAGADEPEQRGRLAGKLQFADHSYTGWIQRRMIAPGRNALCVETAAGLDGEGFRVTLAGQTRNGTEGSHGRNSSEYVIGFSNASLIEEFEAEFGDLEQALNVVDAALEALTRRASEDAKLNDAYVALSAYTWSQVDVTGAATAMKELMAERGRIKNASKRLAELDQLIGELGQQHEDAIGERRLLKDELDKLEERHVSLVDQQASISDELHRLGDEHSVALTEVQSERLDAEFKKAVAPGDPESLADFGANLGRLNVRLRQALQQSEDEVARSESELVKVFIQFKNTWQDEFPNLGTALESYLDYQRILDEIDAGGLAESQAAWQQALTQWSGEDLVPLATSIRNAVSDIFDRLAPVNAILADLPFGARGGHLQIKVIRLSSVPVQQFQRRLRKLSATATADMNFEQAQRRFRELSAFMHELRAPADPRYDRDKSDRQRLLDVRRHVQISALEKPPPGANWDPREYTMLGETSGGETQELVAFIVGSALRFRLGDQLRSRPRFAPVFLDEGFVKADAQFAGRAVEAWKGLGFQIIVGTPEDKVTGLERHMDQLLAITKDPATNYSYVHDVRDDVASVTFMPRPAEPLAEAVQ